MFDAQINSGFTAGGDINISSRFTEITLLHISGNGYTHVYKAKRFGQWHVLKCLTSDVAKEVQYQTLLEKEFRISYPLSHPNIVRTLGIEEVPELGTCIIQEYIDGEPCFSISREQAIELCDAVDYLHKYSIIHRDIKPENILIRKDNKRVVLIDFGLADKADFSILKGGAGTSGYAAPEQWQGEISPLIDIYGIGGVLLTNKRWNRIANKCRQTNPKKRYQSAEAVKRALQRRFPWLIVLGILIISAFVGWSGYSYIITHKNTQIQQQTIEMQQEDIQELHQDNAILIGEVDSLHDRNSRLKQDLESLDNDYRSYRREAEKKQRNLEQELEREHDANARLQHEVNPMFNTSGSRSSAADQLY